MIQRRSLLALPLSALDAPTRDSFRFVHFTDIHIQHERQAAEHTARCVQVINATQADFALAGGDLVFDVNLVDRTRAAALVSLYQRTATRLKMPVYSLLGNHDLFGIGDRGRAAVQSAGLARKNWESEFGPRIRAFSHRGWTFITLDSIDVLPDGGYRGWIDPDQISWLHSTLDALPRATPVIVTTHIP